MLNKLVTCLKCGWVYNAVSSHFVKEWKQMWKDFWPTLDEEGRDSFGLPDGPPDTSRYLSCGCGNSYTNFRDSVDGDCPAGVTISPILDREENSS